MSEINDAAVEADETAVPLDLDAIRQDVNACRTYNFGMTQADRLAHEHAPALIAEVERLRAATVKHDREAVALKFCLMQDSIEHMEQTDDAPCSRCLAWADAVLDLLPGRTEAEVKAEGLREFAARVRDEVRAGDERLGRGWATDEYRNGLHVALIQADEAADRLAAEGGAS